MPRVDGATPTGGALVALACAAFVPPLLLLVGVRNLERYRREPMPLMFGLLGWGATLGVLVALAILHAADAIFPPGSRILGFAPLIFATAFVAPPIEELSKGLGLLFGRHELDELEDGLIHGAAIGLGFAATENFLYGYFNFQQFGFEAAITTILLRVGSSTILHAGTTALLGFGYALYRKRQAPRMTVGAMYVVAFLQHALYNGLVIDDDRGAVWHSIGFVTGILLVIGNAGVLAWLIRRLDDEGRPRPAKRSKDARLIPRTR